MDWNKILFRQLWFTEDGTFGLFPCYHLKFTFVVGSEMKETMIRLIAMRFGTDFLVPNRMKCNYFTTILAFTFKSISMSNVLQTSFPA